MDEETLLQIEDTADELPDEVKDFIFGDGFEAVSQELVGLLTDENQKKDLTYEIQLLLLGAKTLPELHQYIDGLTTTPENKQKIKTIIDEKIINELITIVQANIEIDQEAQPTDQPTSIANQSLSSLSDRLKKASIATPLQTTVPGEQKSAETTKSAIDPYHEPIDNE